MTSGIFAAHFVNTVSDTFLKEIVEGRHDFVEPSIQNELTHKYHAGVATGILNSPDPSFDPLTDKMIHQCYGPDDHAAAKQQNKRFLQASLGLIEDENAPLFFWPSRLDPIQKGCHLLADILFDVISEFWEKHLQIIFVADGEYHKHFRDIARFHGFENRIAVCHFDEHLEHMAYGASDFILMPSRFEPCGLPQMIAPIYGSLPVAHDTGGIHDTVVHMNASENTGNGFLFETYDAGGLFWAIREAMGFYTLAPDIRERQIRRVMKDAAATFNYDVTAKQYIDLYENMLDRPLITTYG